MFSHEKLKVYELYLDFARQSAAMLDRAENWHAFCNHLGRATESIGSNLIRGNAERGQQMRQSALDVAIGSTAECAACFDVAGRKAMVSLQELSEIRAVLWRIRGMLIGLRESHPSYLREDLEPYGGVIFPHERLDVYKVALEVVGRTHLIISNCTLPFRQRNRLDETTTGIALNLAEGVAKPTQRDKLKFVDIAYGHCLQSAMICDLLVVQGKLVPNALLCIKQALERIAAMLLSWSQTMQAELNERVHTESKEPLSTKEWAGGATP